MSWHKLLIFFLPLFFKSNDGGDDALISLTELSNIKLINLGSNKLSGLIPHSIGDLSSLQNISFSSNSMSGPIPDSIVAIPSLVHLDMSSNQFNGTLPKFLSEMKGLKYLNLENNNFQGAIPFNGSSIKVFIVFKAIGTSNLCYNRSIVSFKPKIGIAPCDKDGFPILPTPDKSSSSSRGGGGSCASTTQAMVRLPREHRHHGPSKIVLGVAIGLSSIVSLIIFLILLSK